MLTVRPARDAADFAGLDDDGSFADSVEVMFEDGESRPEWCFVAEEGSERMGRVGLYVSPTTTDPAWLGTLPPQELFVFGLQLGSDESAVDHGRRLLVEALASVAGAVPDVVEVRINPTFHPQHALTRQVMEACGLDLFQEKQGYEWTGGSVAPSEGRLEFRTLADVGPDVYRAVMAPCGEGTLDRNDRYYWQGCGPDNWASQMMVFASDEDAPMWLLGYTLGGEPAGYVAVSRDDELEATISHIGVVPDHRGNGYVGELLTAANEAASRAGVSRMLSDVDVLNRPMAAGMERAGHHRHDPWHLWVYRARTRSIALG